MNRGPRPRTDRITGGGFLSKLLFTGVLTAGASFAVYLYGLRMQTLEVARAHAFATLVFAELLRALGARSETKPVWKLRFGSNLNLLAIVAGSFALQIWTHQSAVLARFVKATFINLNLCLALLAISTVPLAALEILKLVASRRQERRKDFTPNS